MGKEARNHGPTWSAPDARFHERYRHLVSNPGNGWAPADLEAVYWGLNETGVIDELIKFAYAVARRRGVASLPLAEEAVEDKVAYAFRCIEKYDPTRYRGRKCPFLNWLYMMIARAASRRAKREARLESLLRAQQAPQGRWRGRPIARSEPVAGPDLDWEAMRPYLDRLRPLYKEALQLFYEQKMSCAEAARKSSVPCKPGAMKVRLCRARQEVRQMMAEAEDPDSAVRRVLSHAGQAVSPSEGRSSVASKAGQIVGSEEQLAWQPRPPCEPGQPVQEGGPLP